MRRDCRTTAPTVDPPQPRARSPALVALSPRSLSGPAGAGARRVVALTILLIVYGVGATLDARERDPLGLALLLFSVAGSGCAARGGSEDPGAGGGAPPGCSACRSPPGSTPRAWWATNWWWFGAARSVDRVEPRTDRSIRRARGDADDGPDRAPLYWRASVLDHFDGYLLEPRRGRRPDRDRRRGARSIVARRRDSTSSPRLGRGGDLRAAVPSQRARDRRRGYPRRRRGQRPRQRRRHAHPRRRLARARRRVSIVSYVPADAGAAARRAGRGSVRRFSGADPGRAADLGRVAGPADAGDPLWGTATRRRGGVLASPYGEVYPPCPAVDRGRPDALRGVGRSQEHLRATSTHPTVPEGACRWSRSCRDGAGCCQQFAARWA